MRENTVLDPFILPCLVLPSTLAYKNMHLLSSSLLCFSLSPSLSFFFSFLSLCVKNFAYVRLESLSEHLFPPGFFGQGKCYTVLENLGSRGGTLAEGQSKVSRFHPLSSSYGALDTSLVAPEHS